MLAAIVFALASLTDFVDGYLARSRNSVTTFGKLMDPLADKLLIVAALISLVSLHRLAAWVAMVIIARELAVTVLRMGASQAGVIMPASNFGKLKTCVQIAAILGVIAVRDHPAWLDVLVYAAVAITVASGPRLLLRAAPADRARSAQAQRRTSAAGSGARATRAASCAAASGCTPLAISSRISPSVPWRSASTLCWWIVSRFSWRAETNASSGSSGRRATTPLIISRTQSSTKRGRRCAFSTTAASSTRFISS